MSNTSPTSFETVDAETGEVIEQQVVSDTPPGPLPEPPGAATPTPSTALAVQEQGPADLDVLGTVEEVRARLDRQVAILGIVDKAVREHLTPGIDFGKADDRNPKSVLLKPGAEKVIRLFGCHAEWVRDDQTWEMLGKPQDTVFYICRIKDNKTGRVLGEGRGAEKIGTKARDVNKDIKNAEKCAIVDAALYAFCLSNRFTQEDTSDPLSVAKERLGADVEGARTDCESTLTTGKFIKAVLLHEFKKSSCTTVGEVEHLRDVILTKKLYDLATGERIPPAKE
jgi:hypothetical protein